MAVAQGSASPCASRPSYGDKNKARTCSFGCRGRRPSLSYTEGQERRARWGLTQLKRCSASLRGLTRIKPPLPCPPCWAAFSEMTLSPFRPTGGNRARPPQPGQQPARVQLRRVTVPSRGARSLCCLLTCSRSPVPGPSGAQGAVWWARAEAALLESELRVGPASQRSRKRRDNGPGCQGRTQTTLLAGRSLLEQFLTAYM